MEIQLQHSRVISGQKINITGSKSETNRLLLLKANFPQISLEGISESDDSRVMQKALLSNSQVINVHHAGTAMRFLTAYYATQSGKEILLTGSDRMKERPIRILVEALQQLGADISYTEKSGFPPLLIKGKQLAKNNRIRINAGISSQYISALLLIAPSLKNGLQIELEGKVTSRPYILMTLKLLQKLGVETSWEENSIRVHSAKIPPQKLVIESDWSSASYFYSLIALSEIGTEIELFNYQEDSLQGDAALIEIYKSFGVSSTFESSTLKISKTGVYQSPISLNLNDCPDLAQTIVVTCLGLQINCELIGLETLAIKETDRLQALKTELSKFGAIVEISENSLKMSSPKSLQSDCSVATYNDHRMALAFAPLCLKVPLIIQNAEVVSKSFPTYFADLQKIGIRLQEK